MIMCKFTILFLFFISIFGVNGSRVLELSDRFIDVGQEGIWFVKFYAPWCGYCRRLEPVWAHVAQTLYNTPITVAKVDATRFPSIATHFHIRAFPTILLLKDNQRYEYLGERTKEDMVQYAVRMAQEPVQTITKAESINTLKDTYPIFFGYVGKQAGPLWEMFVHHAARYQAHAWFYAMTQDIVESEMDLPAESAVFVYKDEEAVFFKHDIKLLNDQELLNSTLDKWVNAERFGTFPKVTRANINHLMDTGKYLVLAVVAENKLNEITPIEKDFKDMIESIIRKRKHELHERFQFGWVGSPDLANSIAMTELAVPHLIVLNSTTSHHHMPEDDPVLMTPEAVNIFLDQIHNDIAPRYGGSGWVTRARRLVFEARSTLAELWRGNPVLTALLFGLPLGFLSLICYSVCCADIMDADDDDDPPEEHEKRD